MYLNRKGTIMIINAHAKGVLPLLLIALFACAGCAKHEMVKTDEALAPSAVTKPAASTEAHAAPAAPAADTSALKVSPISGGDLHDAATTGDHSAADAALQQKLQTVYFGFDSSALSDDARAALTKNFEVVKKNGGAKVRIEGYCDERGSDEYNLALGERRARAAAQYLETLGVPKDRLTVLSYGNEKPAVQGHDEAAWSKNRRDEFVFVR